VNQPRHQDGKFGEKTGSAPETELAGSHATDARYGIALDMGSPSQPFIAVPKPEFAGKVASDPAVQAQLDEVFESIDSQYGDVDAIRVDRDGDRLVFRGIVRRNQDIEDWADDTNAFHDCREVFEASDFADLTSAALKGFESDRYGVYTIPNSNN